MAADKVKHHKI